MIVLYYKKERYLKYNREPEFLAESQLLFEEFADKDAACTWVIRELLDNINYPNLFIVLPNWESLRDVAKNFYEPSQILTKLIVVPEPTLESAAYMDGLVIERINRDGLRDYFIHRVTEAVVEHQRKKAEKAVQREREIQETKDKLAKERDLALLAELKLKYEQ